jgi:hypothetical protein
MPWHVRGSLLALDLGLGRFRLRRMVDGAMPPPALTDNERRALTDTVVLFNAREVTNADRSAIAAAIARGRARVQAIDRHDAAGLERLSHDSGLSEWRRQAFVWITSREAATRLSLFSLGELLWLGRPEPGLVERLARWGTGATLATGCLCLRLTAPLMPESFEGREDIGLIAAAVPDVLLRIVELLDRFDLPAALAGGLLESVTQDYQDAVQTAFHGDWLRLVRFAQGFTDERMTDHVSALTAVGALVPHTP